jgi:peptidoglycan/xylan/chitin deacetylase (PgdA/CDA1 family)
MNRHALIRVALDAISLSGAPLWLPRPSDASGFVLTLHHVRPTSTKAFDPNGLLSITPQFLDQLLGHFIARGWSFVSVDELVSGAGTRRNDRRLAITLDDGYRNNFEHALPVFRKHRAPFTIFVCPGFTERTSELWWEALERIIGATDALAPPEGGPAVRTRTSGEKLAMFQRWRTWLITAVDETEQRVAVRKLARAHHLDLAMLAEDLVMDWDETRSIASDPLCSIGAHTMTHAALARLPSDAALREITGSTDRITAEIGKRPTSIAFPYGFASAAGPREAALAEQAGLAASFTTRPGYVPTTGSRHGLPRVSVNGLFQRTKYLEALLTPGLWKLRDRAKKAA